MVFFLVLFPLLLASGSIAQEKFEEWSDFTSMKTINQVLVYDNKIWTATSGGVLLYNPTTGEYVRFTTLEGLASNQVLSMTADGHGNLWFGTDGHGLSRLKMDTNLLDIPYSVFIGQRVQALHGFGDRIYVGTNQGISAFLIDGLVVKETYRQLGTFRNSSGVRNLTVSENVLWAGTDEGMAWANLSMTNLQDPDNWSNWQHSVPIDDILVHNDQVLCSSQRGLFLFQPEDKIFVKDFPNIVPFTALGTWNGQPVAASYDGKLYRRKDALDWRLIRTDLDIVTSLSQQDTNLWIGTENGLLLADQSSLHLPNEPPANQFYEMTSQKDGGLWVASVPNDRIGPSLGLFQYHNQHWQLHDRDTGLPSNVPVSLSTDTHNQLWVGTWGNGLAVRDSTGQWQNLTWSNSVLFGIEADNTFVVISDIQRDSNGLMWLANVQSGLAVMDGFPPIRSWRHQQKNLGLEKRQDIDKIAITPGGLKWISTSTNGILLFDDGGTPFDSNNTTFVHLTSFTDSRLSSDRVSDILVNGENEVWVATDNGLNALEVAYDRDLRSLQISDWKIYNTDSGLPSNEINDLDMDHFGQIWIATEAGLSLINSQEELSATYNTINSGLIDDGVKSVLFDAEKNVLWIGTRNGLGRLQLPNVSEKESKIRLFPQPLLLPAAKPLTFAPLQPGSRLQIFTLAGKLVRQLKVEPGNDRILWSGENESGFLVASGIYLFTTEDSSGRIERGKLAVVK